MAMRPCARAGCGRLVKSGYCEACCPAIKVLGNENIRCSASNRGYDRAWQRFRLWFLERHPFCEDCRKKGKMRPATEPHHLKKVAEYPELRLVEENLLALCHWHHSARTAKGE
jgi:5-methylcytosine-specific restriction protein A